MIYGEKLHSPHGVGAFVGSVLFFPALQSGQETLTYRLFETEKGEQVIALMFLYCKRTFDFAIYP